MNDLNNSINSLLDSTLDDLADLPEFKPFPVGAHKVSLKWAIKEVNKKPAVELTMKAIETLELTNKEDDSPLKPGDETNVLFQLDNEFGQGQLKEILKVLQPVFGGNTSKEIIDASQGAEVAVVTKIRVNTNDKDKRYTAIVSMMVA